MTLIDKMKVMFVRPERERAERTVMKENMCVQESEETEKVLFFLVGDSGWRMPGKSLLRQAAQLPNPAVFFWRMESVLKHHDLENLGKAV